MGKRTTVFDVDGPHRGDEHPERWKENTNSPMFVAFSIQYADADYIESADDLEWLIATLQELVSPDVPEDCVVCNRDNKLCAVVLSDGTVIRMP